MLRHEDIDRARILIVDDNLSNVNLLEGLLAKVGYRHLRSTTDPRTVLYHYTDFQPDLLLLDMHMPGVDGFAVMEQLRSLIPEGEYFPILVLTADISGTVRRRALASGAQDFLVKPFDATEVWLRIANLLHTRFLHVQLAEQNAKLEERVRQRTEELDRARVEILERLSLAAEYRDDDTGQHTRRVGDMAGRLAQVLDLPPERIDLIRQAAPLHDIGKLGISDTILLKPGPLTSEEFARVQTHASIGHRILAETHIPVLSLAREIAQTHHERWDGSGYPNGLLGEAIPLSGRIVAVADVYDALTHQRPYKLAWPEDRAVTEIIAQRGHHFDPQGVDALLEILDRQPSGQPWAGAPGPSA